MEVFNQAVPIYLDEQTRMIRYLAWEHVGTCLDWDDHTQICLMANCAAVPFYDILAEDALGYDLECPPLIVLDCHPQQLGTSLTFITWLAQGCARTHTQDWFWDLKLFPKGVLLEVRIEVEKVETAGKVEKVESTLCEWKHGTALNRNRNQQFKLFWRRYTRVINPCFLGFLQRASLGRALQVPSAPLL